MFYFLFRVLLVEHFRVSCMFFCVTMSKKTIKKTESTLFSIRIWSGISPKTEFCFRVPSTAHISIEDDGCMPKNVGRKIIWMDAQKERKSPYEHIGARITLYPSLRVSRAVKAVRQGFCLDGVCQGVKMPSPDIFGSAAFPSNF